MLLVSSLHELADHIMYRFKIVQNKFRNTIFHNSQGVTLTLSHTETRATLTISHIAIRTCEYTQNEAMEHMIDAII